MPFRVRTRCVLVLFSFFLSFLPTSLSATDLPVYTGIYTYKDLKKVRHHLLARMSLLETAPKTFAVILTYYRGSFETPEYFSTFYRFCTDVNDREIYLNANKCRRPVHSEPTDESDLDQPHVRLTREMRNGVERLQGPVANEAGERTGTLILERGFAVPKEMRDFPIEPTLSGTYDGECDHISDEMGRPISITGLASRIRGLEIVATRFGPLQYGSKSVAYDASLACNRGNSRTYEPCGAFKGILDFYRGYFFTQRLAGGGWTCAQSPVPDQPGEWALNCFPDFVEETTLKGCRFRRRNVDGYIRSAYYQRTATDWPAAEQPLTPSQVAFADAIRKQYDAYYPSPRGNRRGESPVALPAIEVKELEPPKAQVGPCPLQSYYEGILEQQLRGGQHFVEMNFRARPFERGGKQLCSLDGFVWSHLGNDPKKTVAIPFEFVAQEIDPKAKVHVLVSNRRDRVILILKHLPDKTWEIHWFSNYFNYYGTAHLAHRVNWKPLNHYVPFIDGNFKETFFYKNIDDKTPKPIDYRWHAVTKENFHFIESLGSPYERLLIDGNRARLIVSPSGQFSRFTNLVVKRVSYDYSAGILSFQAGASVVTGRIFSNGLLFKTISQSAFGAGFNYPEFGQFRMLEIDRSQPIQRPFSFVGYLMGLD